MIRSVRLAACAICLAMVTLLVLHRHTTRAQVPGASPRGPYSHRIPCGGGGCVCAPNCREYGYFHTVWRQWPGEPRPEITFPQSVGIETLPTPQGEERVPLPPAVPVPQPERIIVPPVGPDIQPGLPGAIPGLQPELPGMELPPSLPGTELPGTELPGPELPGPGLPGTPVEPDAVPPGGLPESLPGLPETPDDRTTIPGTLPGLPIDPDDVPKVTPPTGDNPPFERPAEPPIEVPAEPPAEPPVEIPAKEPIEPGIDDNPFGNIGDQPLSVIPDSLIHEGTNMLEGHQPYFMSRTMLPATEPGVWPERPRVFPKPVEVQPEVASVPGQLPVAEMTPAALPDHLTAQPVEEEGFAETIPSDQIVARRPITPARPEHPREMASVAAPASPPRVSERPQPVLPTPEQPAELSLVRPGPQGIAPTEPQLGLRPIPVPMRRAPADTEPAPLSSQPEPMVTQPAPLQPMPLAIARPMQPLMEDAAAQPLKPVPEESTEAARQMVIANKGMSLVPDGGIVVEPSIPFTRQFEPEPAGEAIVEPSPETEETAVADREPSPEPSEPQPVEPKTAEPQRMVEPQAAAAPQAVIKPQAVEPQRIAMEPREPKPLDVGPGQSETTPAPPQANWSSAFQPGFRNGSSANKVMGGVVDEKPALDGYCVVDLIDNERWTPGIVGLSVVHRGQTFYFSNAARREEFLARPQCYIPAYDAYDPVLLIDRARRAKGHTDYCITCNGRLYAFTCEENLQAFQKNPKRYAEAR